MVTVNSEEGLQEQNPKLYQKNRFKQFGFYTESSFGILPKSSSRFLWGTSKATIRAFTLGKQCSNLAVVQARQSVEHQSTAGAKFEALSKEPVQTIWLLHRK